MVKTRGQQHPGAMTSVASESRLSPRSLPFVLVVVLAAFLLLLAAMGFLAPLAAAHGFGVDLADASAEVLVLPDDVLRSYVGGAGLGTWLMHRARGCALCGGRATAGRR